MVYARENTEDTSVDPISLVIEIRSFLLQTAALNFKYYKTSLIHEGGHIPFYSDEINEFSKGLLPSLLNSLIQSLDWNSSDWRDFSISKQECHLIFPIDAHFSSRKIMLFGVNKLSLNLKYYWRLLYSLVKDM